MSNRKTGVGFEAYLCKQLSAKGFWAHNLTQNRHGQPADIIAVKNGKAYLIDCKVCSTDKGFSLSRIEENQKTAMELWAALGNGTGWFAVQLPDGEIHMLPYIGLMSTRNLWGKGSVPQYMIRALWTFDEWVKEWT